MIDVVDEQGQATLDPKLREIVDAARKPDEGFVICAACAHVVAHVEDRIEMLGSHDHVFTNPYGFTHHLACYRQALGCAVHGPAHAADTWFPGFLWRLADCGGCGQHLGWSFEKPENPFYGLIIANLLVK